MPVRHVVKQGESISSIAFKYGFFRETLWNLPENADLRALRREGEILLPGDELHVPDKREKIETVPTGDLHRFKLKNIPSKFNLRLLKDGEPRAGLAYKLEVNGKVSEGKTDKDGWIRTLIRPDASRGKLTLGDGEETYHLNFGYNDPSDTVTGAQARLRNLGFYKGEVDGKPESSVEAVEEFQRQQKLPVTGKLDPTTRKALQAAHGS